MNSPKFGETFIEICEQYCNIQKIIQKVSLEFQINDVISGHVI